MVWRTILAILIAAIFPTGIICGIGAFIVWICDGIFESDPHDLAE